jgi:hypothetical protein
MRKAFKYKDSVMLVCKGMIQWKDLFLIKKENCVAEMVLWQHITLWHVYLTVKNDREVYSYSTAVAN